MSMQEGTANRLLSEKSPYLLQHAHNPVDWYPWGGEAFDQAKKEDKPVFLSIGYSACHWCHVMAHEVFMDEEVAAFLKNHFISVKVDKEEYPAVDHFYMEAAMAMRVNGGWPLSCFLTPDRKPFFAGTYFPQKQFLALLEFLTREWGHNREKIVSLGDEVIRLLDVEKAPAKEVPRKLVDEAYGELAAAFDSQYGGFGGAPKFPTAHNLFFLLRYYVHAGEIQAKEMVEKTLDAMFRGGIFDHIGGGFCRYSTDRQWLAPHFEKMLYDNAILAMAYLEAGRVIDRKYWAVADWILQFILTELKDGPAFCAALDADSTGGEGAFYLFTPDEIEGILGQEEGKAFCRDYDITERGNFEGKSIPNLIEREEILIRDPRVGKVYQYRLNRDAPFRDDKLLTSGNGLALAAFSMGGEYLGREDDLEIARQLGDFIFDRLLVDGRLAVGYRAGTMAAAGILGDYAFVLWGLHRLFTATDEMIWKERTVFLADLIIDLFWQDDTFYLTPKDARDLPLRCRDFHDGAIPSAYGILLQVFPKITAMTGICRYEDIAAAALGSIGGEIALYPRVALTVLSADSFFL